uniref:Uncharacterized protein n=1 Tax=Amphimedon queenslandica TaxID=400682 RepID=A0A1X7T620_AMPQE
MFVPQGMRTKRMKLNSNRIYPLYGLVQDRKQEADTLKKRISLFSAQQLLKEETDSK